MPTCCISKCGSRKSKKHPQLSLHRIPRNKLMRKKWLKAIGEKNIRRYKILYVCSLHFEDSCFNRTLDVIRLREDSVPSIFSESTKSEKNALLEYDPDDELIIVDVSENITNETVYIRDNTSYDNENQEKPPSSTEKAHPNAFETDFNTDAVMKLEKELQKKTLREQKHTKMIQSLKQQNLRLKKQVSYLQKLLLSRDSKS